MRCLRFRAPIAAAACCSLIVAFSVAARIPAGSAAESITPSQPGIHPQVETRLLNDIKYLASDEFEGRGIGTEGLNKAADYMCAASFRQPASTSLASMATRSRNSR